MGYLSSVYLISQYPDAVGGSISEDRLIPPAIVKLIDNHPYTAKYKGKLSGYDFLAEQINSLERLRRYTDLLEGIGALMRRHVLSAGAEQSRQYQAALENWDLYLPKALTCAADCLGLPKGTRLFEVNVPVFHLQLAEIKGRLRIVSATELFH